jgi:predicted DNA-binding transcriptional regulator AlpA
MTQPRVRQTTIVRGLRRAEAANYVGLGVNKFDELVKDGRMPRPKKIDGASVWDVAALDIYFDALPEADNPKVDSFGYPKK